MLDQMKKIVLKNPFARRSANLLFKKIPRLKPKITSVLNLFEESLYPIDIPDIVIQPNLDFLLLELPPRYMPMMPNGLGYVHNILETIDINFQTLDTNIILYHKFHSARLLENASLPTTSAGKLLKDPWDNINTEYWAEDKLIDFFQPDLSELIEKIISASPRLLGLSLNGNNRCLSKRFVREIRKKNPNIIIIVGGYDCVYHNIGPNLFNDFDYMVVKEAELTLAPLVKSLLLGDNPKDLPGVLSRNDSEDRVWTGTPLLQKLDEIDFPRYQWIDTTLYQSFTRNHLIPITASRGCRWGKCRFCAECFDFRMRSPENVVNEIEFMYQKGFHTFHFNESDVNGDPENLYQICAEIIKRGLVLQLVGQLRIHKKNTSEYLKHLAKAGFRHLRFGVDGWSNKTIRLLNKGYNMNLVFQNLKNSKDAGIYTTVNVVIGEPGETEKDIDEIIDNLIFAKDSIDKIESINTLILPAGSEYYRNPEKYNICFKEDKNDIYKKHPYFIPTDLWYSEHPYIDQPVRMNRLDRICKQLGMHDIPLGDFASRRIDVLKEKRDPHKM
ncbi:MAG: radical SAM protein [Desulfobacteraceae bacterium]|nr:radical SAM protein [Desulfobacteraceae bacterium]